MSLGPEIVGNERPKAEATSELGRREQEAWQNILGTRVEVKPLPKGVTPEVRSNLEKLGFGLRYVPALDLGYIEYLQVEGIDRYHSELQRKYPRWKPYESLSYKEQRDHSVPRNLERWFWGRVDNRKIGMPALSGQWMAVETVEKPEYGTKYPRTPFAERIGFPDDRFGVSWNEAHTAIEREKESILFDIGLSRPSANIRLLEAIEWNLLGNREGWGKTNTYEWTNTVEWSVSGGSGRLVVGRSDRGGAAGVRWARPGSSGDGLGFRAAVVLGS